MSSTSATKSPHVLVFPYPAQGHQLSLLDLTHQLSLRNLTITILTTPKNLPTLSPLLSTHPHIQTLILPFPPHPLLPPGVENVKDLGNSGNLPVMAALRKLFDPIIRWFHSHHDPPVAIISDFFLGWTLHLACQLNIPRFAFFPLSALTAAVLHHCFTHADTVKSLDVVEFTGLPRSPSLKNEHLPSLFRKYRELDPDWEMVRDGIIANLSSYGCIFNIFEAFGGGYCSSLKRQMGNDRLYAVGPLSLLGPESTGKDPGLDSSCAHVFRWLDGCPDGSVVYVSFGSQKLLTNDQMEALANGLETSKARFVWVVKTSATQEESGYGVVPDGFEERVDRRGMVIRGWAPQTRLLGHPAVGGFLSHCGWNSTLEGIVGGALILAWPMEAEQFVNARLVVEDLGAGVRVCEGADTVPDPAKLGKVIGESMRGNGMERRKAQELRDKAFTAVRDGGTSLSDLDRLVKELHGLRS